MEIRLLVKSWAVPRYGSVARGGSEKDTSEKRCSEQGCDHADVKGSQDCWLIV